MAKQRNRHPLVDHENLAHLLPSIKLMIIARKNSHIQHNHATKRASCYSHHRGQSALSETNWTLRVSGCSPYLESLPSYTDGAPPWTPTNRGHGITSRPLKRDPRAPREHHGISLRRDPSRLGEVFTRSKVRAGRLGDLSRNGVWASLRQTRLGESDSPGRDYQFLPWFLLQQMYIPIQTTIQGLRAGCVSNSGTRSSNGRLLSCGTDAEEHTLRNATELTGSGLGVNPNRALVRKDDGY
ncbi:hypothetical protein DEO72_LG10g3058 [Vigna unguiculata]|uniref:Uncharacterized protein n=1 Tax=Vigna unguiculata TaxID=3917 RepID=A0A4D6NFV6_VIGUN|nr:hypothetical protein DEO72_LG10g3058 [Vigna unguiculata]